MPRPSDRSSKEIAVGSITMGLAVFIMEYGVNVIVDKESAQNNIGWYAISSVVVVFLTCCLACRCNRRSPQRIFPLDEKKPENQNPVSQQREDSAWIVVPVDMPPNSGIPETLPPGYVPPTEESKIRIKEQDDTFRALYGGMFSPSLEDKSASQHSAPVGLPRLGGNPD